jgi:hypothetical protein
MGIGHWAGAGESVRSEGMVQTCFDIGFSLYIDAREVSMKLEACQNVLMWIYIIHSANEVFVFLSQGNPTA